MKLSASTCASERFLLDGSLGDNVSKLSDEERDRLFPQDKKKTLNEVEYEFCPEAGVDDLKAAGFEIVDFNFAQAAKRNGPLSRENWESWAKDLASYVRKSGVTVGQTHGHWFILCDQRDEQSLSFHLEMTKRSLRASAFLTEKPWMVTHAFTVLDSEGYNRERSLEYNYAHYSELLELGERYGTRIAMENVFPIPERTYFGTTAEDLVEMAEKIHSESFGLCWDFGHANRAGLEHIPSLRTVIPYVKVTHVHDNFKKMDAHNFPFNGSIRWQEILPELTRLGYEGNFNFEVHATYHTMPQSMRKLALRQLYEIGEAMLKMAEN